VASSSGQSIKFEMLVGVDGLIDGLKVATKGVEQSAQAIKLGLGSTGAAAKSAAKEHEGFIGTMKAFRSEQTQQARTARFYANELASIIPSAEGAKNSLSDLIGVGVEALAGGLSFGLAFEGIKLAVGYFHDLAAAEKKALDEWKTYIDAASQDTKAFTDHINDLIAAMGSVTRAEQLLAGSLGGKGGLAEKQAELDAKRNKVLALKQVVDSPGAGEGITDFSVVRARRKEVNDYLADLDRQLEAVHREISARSYAADELDARDAEELASRVADERMAAETEAANWAIDEKKRIRAALKAFDDEETADRNAIQRATNAAFLAVRAEQERKEREQLEGRVAREEEAAAKARAPWEELAGSLSHTWAGLMDGMIKGSLSFGDAIKGVFDSVLQAFLSMVEQMIAKAAIIGILSLIPGVGPLLGGLSVGGGVLGSLAGIVGNVSAPRGGASSALAAGGGGAVSVHFHGAIGDASSFRAIVEHPNFARALSEARRNGVL